MFGICQNLPDQLNLPVDSPEPQQSLYRHPKLSGTANTSKWLCIIVYMAMLLQTQAQKYNHHWDQAPKWGWPKFTYWPNRPTYQVRFTDRISLIILNIPNYQNRTSKYTVIAPSVLIDNSRVLTAYNPFRAILRDPEIANKLVVAFVSSYTQKHVVGMHIAEIVCARQVAFLPDNKVKYWHGSDLKHSPQHDLLIIRVEEEFPYPNFSTYYEYSKDIEVKGYGYSGPLWTFLAKRDQGLAKGVYIYNLGFSKMEIKENNKIRKLYLNVEETLVDCREWMPQEWGYFMCFKNKSNYHGLGAGAMLYSSNKLFGVGSFALWRNNTGIYVFTDVRVYEELLNHTCTDEEFFFKW
ncbi:uncharacterized protein LOC124630929 [Helicoverpa zea]|uniref:uncharacterized protein LOC124630929 n=1 Tax=Helicoverpa zea TaxID=7113 RepID=UPI001F59BBEA|nr:uncharacterized protein LOC124630929 [Helicoverpa zea]